MSQLTSPGGAGSVPEGGILTLTGDINVGGGGPTAVGPDLAGNIDLNGDGIFTQVQDNAVGNQLIVTLLNSGQGTATTIGVQTPAIFTLPLGAVPGTYEIEARVCAFNAATPAGAGWKVFATVRTTGATGVLIGAINNDFNNSEAALINATVGIASNFAGPNTFSLFVNGLAGLTIDWKATLQWTFVS